MFDPDVQQMQISLTKCFFIHYNEELKYLIIIFFTNGRETVFTLSKKCVCPYRDKMTKGHVPNLGT